MRLAFIQYSGTLTNSIGSCADDFGESSGSLDAALAGVTVVGDQMSYSYGSCTMLGTADGPDRVEGQISCLYERAGDTYPVSGTWSMSR